ncbi:MAG: ABC transporter permease subunit [Pseudothermotoga sp.]
MKRVFSSMIIYILVTIGAVLMLLPFAWMVSTSFKARSEVEKWPPQWGSKNFSKSWNVKVKVSRSSAGGIDWRGLTLREALILRESEQLTNVLSIQIDDDPIYRGTITIFLPQEFGYLPETLEAERFESFANQLKAISQNKEVIGLLDSSKSAEEFFSNFFVLYEHGSNALLDRRNYVATFEQTTTNLLNQLDVFERYNSRIDENYREKYLSMVSNAKKTLNETLSTVTVFKKGLSPLLQEDEIEKVKQTIKACIEEISSNSLFEELRDNAVIKLYQARVVEPLKNVANVLETYTFVKDYFKSVQFKNADINKIVFTFLSETEKNKEFSEQLSQMNLPERVAKIVEEEIRHSTKSLPEEVDKRLDEQLYNDFQALNVENLRTYLQQLKQPLSALAPSIKNIGARTISEFVSFNEMVQKLTESGTVNQALQINLEKLESLSKVVENEELFWQMLVQIYENIEVVTQLRKVYNQVQSAMRIIEAPTFVKNIRLNRNQNIEIELKDVHPVYLEDEKYSVRVEYSTSQVFANVFQNYVMSWKSAPFGIYYLNTAFVSMVTTILEVILAAMAAYAFAMMNFPGKNFIFGLFLATMMIPGEVLLVPNFITISKLGWIDTYYALIIPWIVSVFAIFLMRQHFLTLPLELKDAAWIDGCSHFRFLWTIVAPLSKPVIITSALLKFVGSWNAFLWVLIVTNKDKYRTLPVGLQTFSTDVGTVYNQLMAAATFSILPIVILFLFTQKYFIRGVARTGLK